MFHIIYRSIANTVFGQSELRDLLEQAQHFNRTNKITGCLLYYDCEFVQYLEGKKSLLEEIFERIKIDSRHTQVDLLSSGSIYAREFPDWSMAFESFNGPNPQLEYLKLLLSSYFKNDDLYSHLNPTTKKFWVVVKKLLANQAVEKFN